MDNRETKAGTVLPEADRGRAFANLVHRTLTGRGKSELDRVADEMGMSYAAFYNRLRHATPFSADEIQRLLIVIDDPVIADFLLAGTPYVPAERQIGPDTASFEENLARGAERIVIEAADVLRAAHEALVDDHIDHREEITIREAIREAERALLSLRGHLDALR
ncbi:phage regulatory CII family protein [Roseibium sp.]|uniref:phage regulatory CII family protein n=1 Tax=Roseibium sp. TaxID=1936156 RepID=UPI003BB095D4